LSTFPGTVQSLKVAELNARELTVGAKLTLTGATLGFSKQGAVSGSDFTRTAASYANVTGCEVVTQGAAIIIATAQVVAASSVTTAQLKIVPSTGSITGVWVAEVDTSAVGDITSFGATFGDTGPNISTAGTYEVMFVGWVSAAATVDLQGQSDGTRTLTVKIGSQIASSI